MANALATLFLNIRARSADLAIDLRKVEKQLNRLGKSLERSGSMMTRRFTVPLGLGLAASVKAFALFDKAIIESMAKMDEGVDAAGRLNVALRRDLEKTAMDVAETTKFASEETAGAYKFLAEAGFDAATSMKALPVVAKFAQAGQLDLKQATDLLTDATTALGEAMEFGENGFRSVKKEGESLSNSMERVANVITAASLEAATSIGQAMAAVVTRAGTEAKQAGISIEEVGAALAVLAQNGIKAERAGHNFAVVLRDLQRKAATNKDVWDQMGIKVFEEGSDRIRRFSDIIKDVERAFGGLSLEQRNVALGMLNLQDRTQSQFKLFIGFSDQLRALEDKLSSVGGTIDRIAAVQMLSWIEQMRLAINVVRNAAIEIGKELAPALLEIAYYVSDAAKAFKEWSPEAKKFTAWAAVAAAAIGPLVWGLGGLITSTLGVLSVLKLLVPVSFKSAAGLSAAGKAGVLFGGAYSKIGAILARALSPIGLTVTAIIGLIKVFRDFTGNIATQTPEAAAHMMALRQTFPDVTKALEAMRDAGVWALRQLGEAAEWVWMKVRDLIVEIINATKAAARFVPGLSGVLAGLDSAIDGANEKWDTYHRNLSRIKSEQVKVGKAIEETYKGIQRTVASEKFQSAINNFAAKSREITTAWTGMSKWGDKIGSTIAAGLLKVNKLLDVQGEINERNAKKREEEIKKRERSHQKSLKAQEELNKAIQEQGQELDKLILKQGEARADKIIEGVTEAGIRNAKAFGEIRSTLEKVIFEGVVAGYESGVDEGIKNNPKWHAAMEENARLETQMRLNELESNYVPELQKQLEDTYKQTTDFWRSAFENAITGVTFDLEDTLKQIAVGFAAEIAGAAFGAPAGGLSNFQDVGQLIGRELLGSVARGGNGLLSGILGNIGLGGGSSTLSSLLGVGGGEAVGSAVTSSGQAGLLLADGSVVAQSSLAGALAPAGLAGMAYLWGGSLQNSASGLFDSSGSNDLSSGINTALLSNPITAPFGILADTLGFGWGQSMGDAMAQARKGVESWIEENLRALEERGAGLQILDSNGQLTDFGGNFIFGDRGRFSSGGWADDFWVAYEDRGASAFNAVGMALAALTDSGQEIGGQLGLILAENLGTGELEQNLDNLQMFLQGMGVSAEQLTDSLFEMAAAGELTWHEFEVFRQQLEKLPEEGLAAAGDFKTAMDLVLQSGGRGANSLRALHAVAVEAAEAGIDTLDGLKQALLDAGFEVEVVDALFSAFSNRGITSLEEFANASDRTMGGVIADMESAGVQWDKYNDIIDATTGATETLSDVIDSRLVPALDRFTNAIDRIPNSKTVTIRQDFVGGSNPTPLATPFASGGIVKSPTFFGFDGGKRLGLMGEAGAEAILPLVRGSDGLGVKAYGMGGGSFTVNIDARNSEAGMEQRLAAAIRSMEDGIVRRTMSVIQNERQRNGY